MVHVIWIVAWDAEFYASPESVQLQQASSAPIFIVQPVHPSVARFPGFSAGIPAFLVLPVHPIENAPGQPKQRHGQEQMRNIVEVDPAKIALKKEQRNAFVYGHDGPPFSISSI
jgi:hypothetical protein